MTDADNLDQLSGRELHDLAVRRAVHHLDVKFLWDLLRELPAGEAGPGARTWPGRRAAPVRADRRRPWTRATRELAESLRPFYLDYLRQHHVQPRQAEQPQ